jgi:hypothetical protein
MGLFKGFASGDFVGEYESAYSDWYEKVITDFLY